MSPGSTGVNSTTARVGAWEGAHARPHSADTKPSWKTTELFVYLAMVVGVLVTSDRGGGDAGVDTFTADKAWWYITVLTVGYLISRGLAKSGVRGRDDTSRTVR